jgi:inosose dehydratase
MARVALSPQGWTALSSAPVEEFLDGAADAGYAGIEIHDAAIQAFDRQRARLRHLLEERQLAVSAAPLTAWLFERESQKEDLERLRRLADFLGDLNGEPAIAFRAERHPGRRDMVAGEPPLLPLTRDRFAALADALNRLCDACRDFGLTGAFSNRVGTFVETPDEYQEVIERTEPELVYLAPDVGHYAYAGGDPIALVRLNRPRIAYLRLKDFDRAVFDAVCEARLGFLHFLRDGGFKPLGEGSLDLEGILMPFEKAEFGGWACSELEVYAQPPKEAAQVSRAYLRTHLHW